MYASNVETQTAENLGYNWTKDTAVGHRFSKDNRVVWSLSSGRWMTADLVRGHYANHRDFCTLVEALNRPLISDRTVSRETSPEDAA